MKFFNVLLITFSLISFGFLCPLSGKSWAISEDAEKKAGMHQIGYVGILFDEGGKKYLNIDYVQFYTGKEAIKAAIEDHEFLSETEKRQLVIELEHYYQNKVPASPEGHGNGFGNYAPSGFHIRNKSTQIRTFEISENVDITMQTLSHAPDGNYNFGEKISLHEFEEVIMKGKPYWRSRVPFIIEIDNGIVTRITEQYIP